MTVKVTRYPMGSSTSRNGWRKIKRRAKSGRPQGKGKRWTNYREYLRSDKWRRKREKVMERARGRCEVCRINRATQVHHKTYERVYREPMSDLVAICESCHLDEHGLPNDVANEPCWSKLVRE